MLSVGFFLPSCYFLPSSRVWHCFLWFFECSFWLSTFSFLVSLSLLWFMSSMPQPDLECSIPQFSTVVFSTCVVLSYLLHKTYGWKECALLMWNSFLWRQYKRREVRFLKELWKVLCLTRCEALQCLAVCLVTEGCSMVELHPKHLFPQLQHWQLFFCRVRGKGGSRIVANLGEQEALMDPKTPLVSRNTWVCDAPCLLNTSRIFLSLLLSPALLYWFVVMSHRT